MILKKIFFIFALLGSISISHASTSNIFAHCDSNKNGILERSEWEEAFAILHTTIIEKFKLDDNTDRYAESIFLFYVINPTAINNDSDTYLMKLIAFDYCKQNLISKITITKEQLDNFLNLIGYNQNLELDSLSE